MHFVVNATSVFLQLFAFVNAFLLFIDQRFDYMIKGFFCLVFFQDDNFVYSRVI